MKTTTQRSKNKASAVSFPEHGPLSESGREILLSVKNVDITFGKGDDAVKAVQDVSFDIYKGETFSLVGESGSGKTTIGRAVIRVNPLAAGEIQYKGVRISGKIPRALDRQVIRNIQMVFQDPAASLNERATVDYIISEGLHNFHLYKDEADRQQKVENIINEVGLLPEHLTRYPHEFSGGQRQRIGLARAMVMEPELVIADEPISSLDVSIRAQVLNLMKKFQKEKGVTYLFIAHDLSIVRFISDRIGVIYKGHIVEVAEAEELFHFPLHPYTHSLISAIPIPDPQLEKNKALYTYDPSIHDYSKEQPELVCIGHEHYVYGSEKEIAEYRALREKGVPIKSITILEAGSRDGQAATPLENAGSIGDGGSKEDAGYKVDSGSKEDAGYQKDAVSKENGRTTEDAESLEDIRIAPIHDTGSIWYMVLSFFLPVLGLIACFVFRHYKHMRNFKACKKGTIAGFATLGVIVLLFLLLLLLAVV